MFLLYYDFDFEGLVRYSFGYCEGVCWVAPAQPFDCDIKSEILHFNREIHVLCNFIRLHKFAYDNKSGPVAEGEGTSITEAFNVS